MQFHVDGTAPLDEDGWIFVFGSNLAGRHGAGAAKAAARYYGAQYGVGKGRTGRAYALPTKDEELNTLSHEIIQDFVDRFINYVEINSHLKFWMTRVGCGLAGYKDEDIAPLFQWVAQQGYDISWPEEWRKYLESDDI
jgi:hypothetical protein